MALEQSEQSPAPVRALSKALQDYIGRLGQVWVEGQLSEIRRRTGAPQVYMRLRDTETTQSLSLVATTAMIDRVQPALAEGARVVVLASVEFWNGRGDLHLRARQLRAVGIGELLARIEQLKGILAAEGLFEQDRKKPLPFLPRRVGLVCGRNSDAERDVVENARRRWPGIPFEIREVAVQGAGSPAAVINALVELDDIDGVDVIVITRGGGSAEDLLTFSEESLLRAVAAAKTPVVSAIGHERDSPLLDFVADLRASTPTDAARQVVPDLTQQEAIVGELRASLRRQMGNLLDRETQNLDHLRRTRGLADPTGVVDEMAARVSSARLDGRRALTSLLNGISSSLAAAEAQLHALSPAATLERGYSITLTDSGVVARAPSDVRPGSGLLIRLAHGDIRAVRTDNGLTDRTANAAQNAGRPAEEDR